MIQNFQIGDDVIGPPDGANPVVRNERAHTFGRTVAAVGDKFDGLGANEQEAAPGAML